MIHSHLGIRKGITPGVKMLDLSFKFVHVEETPYLPTDQAIAASSMSLLTLISGVIVNLRVFKLLWREKQNGCTVAINNLFLMYNIVSLVCHPPLLVKWDFQLSLFFPSALFCLFPQVYFAAKPFIFPIGDFIGESGCGFLLLFLDIFIRTFALLVPFSIALVRYIFISMSSKAKLRKTARIVKTIIYMTLFMSVAITLVAQFPADEFAQGPYFFCIGRFEVYFNPQHLDPVTPGRRKGMSYCDVHFKLLDESYDNWPLFALRLLHFFLCWQFMIIYVILTFSFLDAALYAVTFYRILDSTKAIAKTGILRPDIVRNRRNQNTLNIYITFLAWLIQYIANLSNLLAFFFIFGSNNFLQLLFSLFQLSFNFTVMPFLYILVADRVFKDFLIRRQFMSAFLHLINLYDFQAYPENYFAFVLLTISSWGAK